MIALVVESVLINTDKKLRISAVSTTAEIQQASDMHLHKPLNL